MTDRSRQIYLNIGAFAVLFLMSLYRQVSLKYFPEDPYRTWLVFLSYIVLLMVWIISIQVRVTQRTMRHMLIIEAFVMMGGMTIRFIQDTFFYDNISFMRISGLCLACTFLPGLLLGFFAILGMGRSDLYRINAKWQLLWLPVAVFAGLIISDEYYHFFFYIVPEEVEQTLAYHPSIGVFLLLFFSVVIMIWRVIIIFRKNRALHDKRVLRWLIPLIEPIILVLFTAEYFLVSLQIAPGLAGKEVIELFAKIYYAEILAWEIYIFVGLVPVNSNYQTIFENATVNMQILFDDGQNIISKNADIIPDFVLKTVTQKGYVDLNNGHELHGFRLTDAWFFWNQDVSTIQDEITGLNENAAILSQESILLGEELSTKNEEVSLQIKNQIYDELIEEVRSQLDLMKKIIKKKESGAEQRTLLMQLHILGTYIKRRCNLSLLWKETGMIRMEDLIISVQDMLEAVRLSGVTAKLEKENVGSYTSVFSLCLIDTIEMLFEQERFSMQEIQINLDEEMVSILICSKQGVVLSRLQSLHRIERLLTKIDEKKYRVILKEGI